MNDIDMTSTAAEPDKESLLQIKNMDLCIGKRTLAHNIQLTLAAESCTAIIGPNGAGKSTFLKTIIGLLPCRQGQILINGNDVAQMSQIARARCIAYVPQQSQLQFPVPVEEVVAWARYQDTAFQRRSPEDDQAIEASLRDYELIEMRDKPFNQLSGGEQRRVLLARAAASRAPLILLDEPMAHLDMHYILRLRESLRALQERGKTLLMVLHDLRDVAACVDEVLLLGKKKLHGPSLLSDMIDSGVLQDIYGVTISKQEQYTFG